MDAEAEDARRARELHLLALLAAANRRIEEQDEELRALRGQAGHWE